MAVSGTSPWIRTDLGNWEPITTMAPSLHVPKDSVLFHQDDPSGQFYIVKSGRIRITTYEYDGSEKQLYIAEAGAVFGEQSCFLKRPHSTTAVAIVDAHVYAVPYAQALQALAGDFELNTRFLEFLCYKCAVLERQILELSFSSSAQRIAQVLIDLSEIHGTPGPSGTQISIRFTHQDVANLVNTSRVTVSKVLGVFTAEGLIAKHRGRTVLCDPAALRRIAARS